MTKIEGADNMTSVVVEKARVNLWNIIGFGVLLVSTGFGWGTVYSKTEAGLSEAKAETARINAHIEQINTRIQPISNLQYQTTRALEAASEAKTANDETNKRIDRAIDSFSTKVDTVISVMNSLNVKVEVLNSRIGKDHLQGK